MACTESLVPLQLVDDLAATFQLSRADLNVVCRVSCTLSSSHLSVSRLCAASIFEGPLMWLGPCHTLEEWRRLENQRQRGHFYMFSVSSHLRDWSLKQASLIPLSEDIAQFEVGESLTWVLVVEKEVRLRRMPASLLSVLQLIDPL